MQLPQQFLINMKNLLGADYDKYVAAMHEQPVTGMRVNTIKADEEILKEFDIDCKVPYSQNGYVYKGEKLGKHPYHIAGLIYMQEPSSMLPVCASGLAEEKVKNIKVLDLCAAPGGKSGQIAEILNREGVLVSNEIEKSRAKILQSNIERLGYKNVIITNNSPETLSKELPTMFDYIFVDAPCGGEGMFRKDPSTILEWKEERLESNSKRQKEILCEAHKMLKPNGKLIYSTCTFAKKEDEDVCEWFAKEFDYSFLKVNKQVEQSTTYIDNPCCRRFYPFLEKGEGQFVCVMQKNNGEVEEKRPYKEYKIGNSELKLINEFVDGTFELDFAKYYTKIGNNYCLINSNLQNMLKNMQKLAIINAGVTVGTIEKNRFVPHHNMFTAFGNIAKNKLDFALENKNLQKYLHGEELENENYSSYVAVCVNGFAIGGAKATGSRLKNMFPKGLRI